jgi:predicted HicB family RNase H-like nuclease
MTSFNHKQLEIKHAAERLFAIRPDWMTFYREIMGLHGLIREAFPDFEGMAKFEQTDTYREIHRMLAELRKSPPPKELAEDTKVITVRIPQSLHEALRIEAYEHHTSLNILCISKLVQFIDTQNVPTAFDESKPAEFVEKVVKAGL